MKLKYDDNWLFKSTLGFGTYLHILNDAVLITNRIAHVKTKTFRLTLRRFNHVSIPFYKFDCSFCYNDADKIDVTSEDFNSVVLEVLNHFVNEIEPNSVISFVSEPTDSDSIHLNEYLIKHLKKSGNLILSNSDFSKLNIPTDNKHKFFGFSRDKNILQTNKLSILTRIINMFRKQNG
jgi:hypothetical protein